MISPLYPLCLGFISSIIGYYLHHETRVGIILLSLTGSVLIFLKTKNKIIFLLVLILSFLGGIVFAHHYEYGNTSQLSPEYFDKKITLTGIISDDPDRGIDRTRIVIKILSIDRETISEKIPDRVIANIGKISKVFYGDQVFISGILHHPESFITDTDREFDYPKYLAVHNIYATMQVSYFEITDHHQANRFLETLFIIKQYFVDTIKKIFPSPESGLFAGIIIGEKSLLPKEVLNDFQLAGLTHIIVLSGYNITIIALAMMSLLAWFGLGYRARRVGVLITIPIFLILTGLGASSVRAGIMSMTVFFLQIMTRPANATKIILLTLSIMVAINPRVLLYDPSLHLSFLAFLGLVYVVPIAEKYAEKFSVPEERSALTTLIIETSSVQVFVLPYIFYMSGRISLLLLISNIVTVPIIPLIMGAGFVATLFGMIIPPLAAMISFPVKIALSYIIWIADRVSAVEALAFTIPPFGVWMMVGVYAVLVLILIHFHRKKASCKI